MSNAVLPTNYAWATDFSQYIKTMTRGHGYGGEKFWDEEEAFLKEHFLDNQASRILNVGCGLFRELDTLRQIAKDLVCGMDSEESFINYIKPLVTDAPPQVSVKHANIYTATIPPEERFDLVLMLFSTLGFLPDIPLALKKLFDTVAPDGQLIVSVWLDNDAVTQERRRIYTNENTESQVEYNSKKEIFDIVIYKQREEIFRSGILTKEALQKFIQAAIPEAEVDFVDLDVSRIIILKKSK